MDIKSAKIDETRFAGEILPGEIENIKVYYRNLCEGEIFMSAPQADTYKVFILASGEIDVNGKRMCDRGLCAFSPDDKVDIEATTDSALLEINLFSEVAPESGKLPYFINYANAHTYREDCKSEKTVSRMLLEPRIVPNLAVGSVETYGKDRVDAHEHPDVEQLFFGFSENDMHLKINGELTYMGGNTLVHIPLASTHGVEVEDGGCAHYVWIDYIINERGLEYMDSAHEM